MDPVKVAVPIVVVGAARRPVRRVKVETGPNIILKTKNAISFVRV